MPSSIPAFDQCAGLPCPLDPGSDQTSLSLFNKLQRERMESMLTGTYADIEELKRDVGFEPKTELATGIARWAEWYRAYTRT